MRACNQGGHTQRGLFRPDPPSLSSREAVLRSNTNLQGLNTSVVDTDEGEGERRCSVIEQSTERVRVKGTGPRWVWQHPVRVSLPFGFLQGPLKPPRMRVLTWGGECGSGLLPSRGGAGGGGFAEEEREEGGASGGGGEGHPGEANPP